MAQCHLSRPPLFPHPVTGHAASQHGLTGSSSKGRRLPKDLQALEARACQFSTDDLQNSTEDLLALLQDFINRKDVAAGRKLHSLLVVNGLDSLAFIGDHLIRLFAHPGCLDETNQTFSRVSMPTVYTWNAIISAHVTLDEHVRALYLFTKMQCMNVEANRVTFLTLLKACYSLGAIREGLIINDMINKSEYRLDLMLQNTLVDMYAKCGCLDESCKIFNSIPEKNVVSWGVMITGYSQLGFGLAAIELFWQMQQQGINPDKVIFLSTLKACVDVQALTQASQIYEQVTKCGLESDVAIGSTLIDMYCKCGMLDEARRVFNGLTEQNVVSWGVLIAGYIQEGHSLLALYLFIGMQHEGIEPDIITYLWILRACGSIGALMQGRLIHEQVNETNLCSDMEIGIAMIDFYAKCGSLEDAYRIFHRLPNKIVAAWNAIISGYVEHGNSIFALQLFKEMLINHVNPCNSIFLSVLKACGILGALQEGRLIHDQVLREKLDLEVSISSSMVDMYAKCESLEEAHRLFDTLSSRDVVSWCALISGYANKDHADIAVGLFERMLQDDVKPDKVVFLSILKAYSDMRFLEKGRSLHKHIIDSGLLSDEAVGNSLVSMYLKCGSLEEAQVMFDELPTRTVVTWSALMGGFVDYGYGYLALELFEKMQKEKVTPNEVTHLYLVKACSIIGALKLGRLIHNQIIRNSLVITLPVGSMLVDLYARCGSLNEAHNVFEKLPSHDAVSWGALIAGYAQHKNCRLCVECLSHMQKKGLNPTNAIFASIITACSNAGLIAEGWHYFHSMKAVYGITPSMEHYSCMIDLLGRSGCLKDADRLIQSMPVYPNIVIWTSLLTSCRTYGNMEMGKHCFDQALSLNPDDASSYLLMSSMFADAQMWLESGQVQESRKSATAVKQPGRAWFEENTIVHEFIVGGFQHPLCDDELYMKLMRVSSLLKNDSFVPQTDALVDFK